MAKVIKKSFKLPGVFGFFKRVAGKVAGRRKSHPVVFWSVLAVILSISISLLLIPKSDSEHFRAQVNAPEATRVAFSEAVSMSEGGRPRAPEPSVRKLDSVRPLFISFVSEKSPWGAEVAAAEFINKDITNHVRISPAARGVWRMEGAGRIVFTPEHDWAAGVSYNVRFDRKLFASLNVDTAVNFKTAPFSGQLESFAFYPNRGQKRSLIAVAVVEFSHALNSENFNRGVTLKLGSRDVKFSVKFDNLQRQAFIYSDPVSIESKAQNLRLAVRASTAQGGGSMEELRGNLTVQPSDDFFRVNSADARIIRNSRDIQEQILMIGFTDEPTSLDGKIRLYQLPRYKTEDQRAQKRNHNWQKDELTDEVMKNLNLQPLELKATNVEGSGGMFEYGFLFRADEEQGRQMYLVIEPGIKSENGFELTNASTRIMSVPVPSKIVKIVGGGSILPLGGSRELSLVAEGGVRVIRAELARVNATEINHLVTQTNSLMPTPNFSNWKFDETNMSTIFRRDIQIARPDASGVRYASVNLGDYVNSNTKGVFVIDVYNADSRKGSSDGDRRLVILTDIGIVSKHNLDNTVSVFAVSVTNGRPISDANVSVFGKNGQSLINVRTGSSGRADLPAMQGDNYRFEREPVAIVVTSGSDLSFIPFSSSPKIIFTRR